MHLADTIDHILPLVRKPGRYTGGELHACRKNWDDVACRFVLVFPDLYEIGMSHFGLQILYHILNREQQCLAERCFCPDVDMEAELRRHGVPLFSLESRRPLAEFDVIGITLPYELCYTNILTVLDLAGLPLRSEDRGGDDPLVIGGGSCGMNPEPVADFFDAIVLGDGEEAVQDIAALLEREREGTNDREHLLEQLAAIPGVYVPSFFRPRYLEDRFVGMDSLKPGYESVCRRVLPRLLPRPETGKPIVPIVRPIHDRLGIEIARGCTRGCRFCQAGILYRPVRERSAEEVMNIAEQDIARTGFDELALLSLSTGDYACLPQLMTRLMDRFADQYVSVSMPSMRVGTLTQEIMDQIKRVRKTGFTIAPEAGTDRLREVINKGITEADLLETCHNAFSLGWNLLKLYFMVGLPTETWEDVDAIAELARKARSEAGPRPGRTQINVSVGTFVPKPHTPFQWERQLSLDESVARIDRLKKLLPRKGFKLKWHDPRQSYMEGVFSRGDRRLSHLVESAWTAGVRLDGWSEHYRLENWQQAARVCGLDLDSYLEARDVDQVLPWDHLYSGVDREFLVSEQQKARDRIYTPDCRTRGCQKCGLCDFKTLMPVVHKAGTFSPAEGSVGRDANDAVNEQRPVFVYRVRYTRLGDSRFYSHLEVLQLIFRALSRAGVKVLHSQGFNPSPRVSFSQALPVGMESEVEHFDMALGSTVHNLDEMGRLIEQELPEGMEVRGVELKKGGVPEATLTTYTIILLQSPSPDQQERVRKFLAAKEFIVEQVRKKKRRSLDIRPLVRSLEISGKTLSLSVVSWPARAGVSPRDILLKVLCLSDDEVLQARMRKNSAKGVAANT